MRPQASSAVAAAIVAVLAIAGARASEPAPDGLVTRAKDKTTITLLVAYTARAKRASPNIVREARSLVRWANTALKKSGAKVRLKMVKPLPIRGYNDASRTISNTLSDLGPGRLLESVVKARDRRQADLVTVIREGSGPGSAGICVATLGVKKPSSRTDSAAFSVIARTGSDPSCLRSDLTWAVGTLIGLDTDRFAASKPNSPRFNFGYVNLPARIRTIMASQTKCRNRGFDCKEIQRFSTPRRKYQGKTIGVAAGTRGAADNVQWLNLHGPTVAAYR